MRNILVKVVERAKAHFMLSTFSENRVVYDIMRTNVTWPEDIIRNVLFSYWKN